MNFFRIFLGYIIQLQVNVTCNPVPNPGTAESSMSFLPTKQNLITDYWHQQEYSRKGEGYHGTTAVVGADRWIDEYCTATANSGQRPPMGYRSNAPIRPQTAVHKRSFKRACTRAIRNGAAHYHGQLMQVRDFPIKLVQKIQQAQQSSGNKIHPMDRQWNHKDRLICLHWNPWWTFSVHPSRGSTLAAETSCRCGGLHGDEVEFFFHMGRQGLAVCAFSHI